MKGPKLEDVARLLCDLIGPESPYYYRPPCPCTTGDELRRDELTGRLTKVERPRRTSQGKGPWHKGLSLAFDERGLPLEDRLALCIDVLLLAIECDAKTRGGRRPRWL